VRPATVLFCDLRGFTAAAERMSPETVVAALNEFFSTMSAWVRECGGFVDKFIGDAMLVVFGLFGDPDAAPRAAADAIRCAVGMPERLAALNARRQAAGQWPLVISVGIDSGAVLAGTIGAEDRLEYTVIGDAVNVANRLQAVGKDLGCTVLVGEATVELARQAGYDPPLHALDTVPLRGRHGTVRVYGTEEGGKRKEAG
jgi:class 3 adenylate cyclase